MDNYKYAVGRNIRKYRMFNEIKQEDLAKAIGVSRITLSNYENGKTKISIAHITILSQTLNVTIEILLKID
jgi:transcriptional regulator with XRE-family HTH domain